MCASLIETGTRTTSNRGQNSRPKITGRLVRYAGGMRYPDGGGLDTAERARREKVRLAADQCWTLVRIADQVWRRFGVEYTLAGMDVLLHRLGWRMQ